MKKIQGIFAAALCAAIFTMPAFGKCDDHKAQAKKVSDTKTASCCAAKQMTATEKADHCATADKASCEMKGAKAQKVSKKSTKTTKTAKAANAEVKLVKETSSK